MKRALLTLGLAALQTVAAPLKLPYREVFAQPPLSSAWNVDTSGTNRVEVVEGALQITAALNTYAHVERTAGVDLIRASCRLQPGGGISWVGSMFLYWDPRNWCQVSVLRDEPNYYAVQLIDGQLLEHRRMLPATADWYHLAIALGRDGVRFEASPDGRDWTSWLVLPRPKNWQRRPPALLVLGKGFSRTEGDPQYPAADLDNDYGQAGPLTVCRFSEVAVEHLSSAELRLTPSEKKQLTGAGHDHLGEMELADRTDPSLASVSRHFPPMKFPRESLGVKDGPQEIVVLPDGSLDCAGTNSAFRIGTPPVRLGESGCRKRLHEGWLPVVIAETESNGLQFEQTAFGWSPNFDPDARLSAFVRLRISNPGPTPRELGLQFGSPDSGLAWDVTVPSAGQSRVEIQVPFAQPARAMKIQATEFDRRLEETAVWWKSLLSRGAQIQVPEAEVNDAWRAWLAYNFINVDKCGDVYEPHDGGGGFYEQVYGYSASRYCYALDLFGHAQEAQRYLDSILTFVTPEGLLIVNYGLPDAGAQLWAMSQHFRLTQESQWLQRVAPVMVRIGDWILAARRNSMAGQERQAPWYGLLKYRPYCDEPNPTYSFHTDTYLALGLREAADALDAAGLAEPAARFRRESVDYARAILRSMDRSVVRRDGMDMLPMFPETRALLERVNYSGADYYSLVSSMVLETGLLPARDRRARTIADLLENRHGLCLGACAFREGIDHAYTYGYWMNCLERDEVKRVILGFYTSMAYGMSRGTYSGVEVTWLRTGRNEITLPHLYSGTHQLLLLRNMLLCEEGEDLWIARAIPRPWLEGGNEVRVQKAPTLFGPTSFTLRSTAGARQIVAEVQPPTQRIAERIRLRLRHPEQRTIRRVTIDGVPRRAFAGDTVTLRRLARPAVVVVTYD